MVATKYHCAHCGNTTRKPRTIYTAGEVEVPVCPTCNFILRNVETSTWLTPKTVTAGNAR